MNLDDKSGLYITAIVGIVAIVGMVFLFSNRSYVMPSQSGSMMTVDSGAISEDIAGQAYRNSLPSRPFCYRTYVCTNSTFINSTFNSSNSSMVCYYDYVCKGLLLDK